VLCITSQTHVTWPESISDILFKALTPSPQVFPHKTHRYHKLFLESSLIPASSLALLGPMCRTCCIADTAA